MKGQERGPRNVDFDPAARDRLEAARDEWRSAVERGASAEEIAQFLEEVERFADAAGWDTPEIREQVRTGHYRAPGFVIEDERGYDRELAKRSVGPGWHALIDEAFDRRDREFPDARFVQVKEKWGALVMYIEAPHEQIGLADVVDALEDRSLTICERCGAPGVLREGPWLMTLCEEHAEGRPPFGDRRSSG